MKAIYNENFRFTEKLDDSIAGLSNHRATASLQVRDLGKSRRDKANAMPRIRARSHFHYELRPNSFGRDAMDASSRAVGAASILDNSRVRAANADIEQ